MAAALACVSPWKSVSVRASRCIAGSRSSMGARHRVSSDGSPSMVVDDRVASALVDPGGHRGGVLELPRVAVDAQHDLLEDVLGDLAVANAPADEGEQPRAELAPDRLRVRRHGRGLRAHRHPHSRAAEAPQHSSLSTGAQHDACSAGVQQALACGSGGVVRAA